MLTPPCILSFAYRKVLYSSVVDLAIEIDCEGMSH
jgi:hypothetical protein